ncbi:MAG: hypothetical protein AVDCRST_MAG59-1421, partial [uncultured Thermomicrobiales bacterium]
CSLGLIRCRARTLTATRRSTHRRPTGQPPVRERGDSSGAAGRSEQPERLIPNPR